MTASANVRALNRYIGDTGELARELAEANVIVCNRERTKVTPELIAALPNLELVVTSGMHNGSIDMAAARARGIPVCGTRTLGYPTAELTVGLILSFFRNIPGEVASLPGRRLADDGRPRRARTRHLVLSALAASASWSQMSALR